MTESMKDSAMDKLRKKRVSRVLLCFVGFSALAILVWVSYPWPIEGYWYRPGERYYECGNGEIKGFQEFWGNFLLLVPSSVHYRKTGWRRYRCEWSALEGGEKMEAIANVGLFTMRITVVDIESGEAIGEWTVSRVFNPFVKKRLRKISSLLDEKTEK